LRAFQGERKPLKSVKMSLITPGCHGQYVTANRIETHEEAGNKRAWPPSITKLTGFRRWEASRFLMNKPMQLTGRARRSWQAEPGENEQTKKVTECDFFW